MTGAAWVLETVLVLLLAATLFHALRLERALGVLKRDRAVLEALVEGFNDSTRQAETGVERLRAAADGAGRQMARQIETAQRLRDDLAFFSDRSEKLAERLESAVRAARMLPEGALLQGISLAATQTAQSGGAASGLAAVAGRGSGSGNLAGLSHGPGSEALAGFAGSLGGAGSPHDRPEPAAAPSSAPLHIEPRLYPAGPPAQRSGVYGGAPVREDDESEAAQAAQATRDAERLAEEIARLAPPRLQPSTRLSGQQAARRADQQGIRLSEQPTARLSEPEAEPQPRLRSQAERDLLRALRGTR